MKRKIIRAEASGFCMGVRRAVQMVYDALDNKKGEHIATLGPIIHNRQVVEDLANRGVTLINTASEAEGKEIVVRAHGAPPEEIKILKEMGCVVHNGTCPNVIASQKIVAKYSSEGYTIIIAGDKNHGEVVALAAHAGKERCQVISGVEDAQSVVLGEKNLLLCQTTIKQSEFDQVAEILLERDSHLILRNTICRATEKRQKALLVLKEKVEAFVIIGGLNSANTQRLQMAALSTGKPSWHIETAQNLPIEIFSYSRIGVSAGASTPEEIIEEVIKALEEG